MKIICTKQEKSQLISTLVQSQVCPIFIVDACGGCGFTTDADRDKCVKCYEDHIDWEIIDE